MYCKYCGNPIDESSRYCSNCGKQLLDLEKPLYSSNDYYEDDTIIQSPDVNYDDQIIYSTPKRDRLRSHRKEYGTKWLSFITKVQIWLVCIQFLSYGIRIFTGQHLGDLAEEFYSLFPACKALDVIYGIFYLSMIIVAFLIRNSLQRFETKAPKHYLTFYAVFLVVDIFYLIVASAITKINIAYFITSDIIVSVLVSIIVIICNSIYFKHRKYMFVN